MREKTMNYLLYPITLMLLGLGILVAFV